MSKEEEFLPLKPLPGRYDLFYPDLELNISKILPAVLSLFGKQFPEKRLLDRYLKEKEGWLKIKESTISNVMIVILDAVGLNHFMKHSEKLKEKFETNGLALSSIFPTITSACLATLHLGEMPVKHGILGHKIWFKEIDNIVDTLTLIAENSRKGDLTGAGVSVKNWLWSNFLLPVDSEITQVELIEKHIANIGLSNLIHGSPCAIGYSSHIDCFAAAKRILERGELGKKLLDIYIGSTDHVSHRYTPDSEELGDEVKNIEMILFRMLERLNPKIASETAVFITADHGQEKLLPKERIIISQEEEEELASLLKTHGKSGRVLHLFSKDGKREELIKWFEKKIGEKGVIITPEQYPKFLGKGANCERVIERIGDVQIILGRNSYMFFGHSGEFDPTFNLGLNASHGSLSRNELVVPLIVGKADDLIK